ncbi:hypothetical protein JK207_00040 [Gluconobacter cerinus]|uniref:hypothetical protein n=1 Tax=Gluconobacter TaxID=441 RepID=UPI001B8B0708|nr:MULTISPECIES: hypothetical protein [Gluconobacter]MBS0995124.1 hypothetical protein [Gluconobacter cerinus]MBS1020424.1 hypothetical protein [Gluconobacter cerinus]
MLKTHTRTWLGIIACLLMQVGLMAGAFPAHAASRAHAMAMTHCVSMTHKTTDACDKHSMPGLGTPTLHDHHHAGHGQGCCHIHSVSAEPLLTLANTPSLSAHPAIARRFAKTGHTSLSGTDWIPTPPPPKQLIS